MEQRHGVQGRHCALFSTLSRRILGLVWLAALFSTSVFAADTTPPSAPSTVSATASSSTQINLSWTASTDNVGVTNYLIERCQSAGCTNFALLITINSTSYSDASLMASLSYSYRIRATDAANNLSVYSNIATALTQNNGPITYTYSYDANGRVTQVSGSDGSQQTYQYDANGNATTINRQ